MSEWLNDAKGHRDESSNHDSDALLNMCQAMADETPLVALRVRVDHAVGRSLLRQDQHARAWERLSRAATLQRRMASTLGPGLFRGSENAGAPSLYDDAVQAALDASGPDMHARVVSMLEAAQSLAVPGGMRAGLDPQAEAALRPMLDALRVLYSRLGPTGRGGGTTTDALRAQIIGLEERVLRQLDLRELGAQVGGDGHFSISPLAASQTLTSVQSRLETGVLCVYLFVDGQSVSSLAITRDSSSLVRGLCELTEVRSMVWRLGLSVSRALTTAAPASTWDGPRELWRRFMEPILAGVPAASRVLVIPAPLLLALPIPAATAAFSGLPAAWSPGLALGSGAREGAVRQASLGRQVLAVGVDDEHAPGMSREAAAVAACHERVERLVGSHAAAESVLQALARADLAHLACHGVHDPEFPLSSRLLLADRWVTARELMHAVRPGSAVILAGCETGSTGPSADQDHTGLARAVLSAGAGSVLASQWPLHDLAAEKLFVDLHARAARQAARPRSLSASIVRALAESQHEAMRCGAPWEHWACVNAWEGDV